MPKSVLLLYCSSPSLFPSSFPFFCFNTSATATRNRVPPSSLGPLGGLPSADCLFPRLIRRPGAVSRPFCVSPQKAQKATRRGEVYRRGLRHAEQHNSRSRFPNESVHLRLVEWSLTRSAIGVSRSSRRRKSCCAPRRFLSRSPPHQRYHPHPHAHVGGRRPRGGGPALGFTSTPRNELLATCRKHWGFRTSDRGSGGYPLERENGLHNTLYLLI